MNTEKYEKLVEYKNKKTILEGRVTLYLPPEVAGQQSIVSIDFEGSSVIIPKNEMILPGRTSKLKSLVGTTIDFIITDVDKDSDMILGSNKQALEIIQRPIIKKLNSGKEVTVRITNILDYGAYCQVNGVSCFMLNEDFSRDTNRIKDICRVGDAVEVTLKKISEQGKIYVQAKDKYCISKVKDIDEYKEGSVVFGYINRVYPSAVGVRIGADMDCMCYPPEFFEISNGQNVTVKIEKVIKDKEKNKIRGKIVSVLD